MKRTLTINLSGIVFYIDEDAYDVLQEYIKKLEQRFTGDDGKEILHDIEARLAELFGDTTKHNSNVVVTIAHVNDAIAQLGTAEEIGGEASDMRSEESSKEERKLHRKFYRDGDNKVLGGVASGLAAYLGFDVTIVRLVFVLLAITILGWLIPIYLLVWLIAPEAKTTAQKLEMQGIEPSIENIKEYLNSEKFKESASRIGSRLGDVVMWIFRIAAIAVGLCFIVIGAFIIGALLIALVGMIVGGGSALGAVLGEFLNIDNGNSSIIVFFVSTLIALLIPVISIIIATIRLIRRDNNPRKSGWGWMWFIVWIVAIIVSINSLIFNIPNIVNAMMYFDENDIAFFDDDDSITEVRLSGETFDSIDIDNALIVKLVEDSCCYVEVKGSASTLRNISSSIENNTLCLGCLGEINTRMEKHVIVHYCSELRKIELNSASVLSNDNKTLITKDLELDIESAAVVNLGVKCERLDVDAESAAVVNIWGECEYLEGDLASAAVANFKDLTAQNTVINASSAAVVDAP